MEQEGAAARAAAAADGGLASHGDEKRMVTKRMRQISNAFWKAYFLEKNPALKKYVSRVEMTVARKKVVIQARGIRPASAARKTLYRECACSHTGFGAGAT